MGTPLPIYYLSIVITYGLTFLLIAVIGALEIGALTPAPTANPRDA